MSQMLWTIAAKYYHLDGKNIHVHIILQIIPIYTNM